MDMFIKYHKITSLSNIQIPCLPLALPQMIMTGTGWQIPVIGCMTGLRRYHGPASTPQPPPPGIWSSRQHLLRNSLGVASCGAMIPPNWWDPSRTVPLLPMLAPWVRDLQTRFAKESDGFKVAEPQLHQWWVTLSRRHQREHRGFFQQLASSLWSCHAARWPGEKAWDNKE